MQGCLLVDQLVGPIDVVSPEHSSGDRSHEFQIASLKNASIEFSKAEYARPTKAELAHCTTSACLSKYAQSQKLSSLTSQKYWIFPQELWLRGRIDTLETVFQAAARNFTIRLAERLAKYLCSLIPFHP